MHFKPVLAALFFAILLISSSYLFKGDTIGDWVDAGIYIVALSLAGHYYRLSGQACKMKFRNK